MPKRMPSRTPSVSSNNNLPRRSVPVIVRPLTARAQAPTLVSFFAASASAQPRVIVAHNICRGLDLAATAEVHRRILDFAAAGGAVLLISSDLDELLAICGRLLILRRGKIRETNPGERDPQRLGLLMAGAGD